MSNTYYLVFNDPASDMVVLIDDMGKPSDYTDDFVHAFKCSLSDDHRQYVDMLSEYEEMYMVSNSPNPACRTILDLYGLFYENYEWGY